MTVCCSRCGFENAYATGFCHDCLASLDRQGSCDYCDEHLETLRSVCEKTYRGEISTARLCAVVALQRARVLESLAELGEADPDPDSTADVDAMSQARSQMDLYLEGLSILEEYCSTAEASCLEEGLSLVEQANQALNAALQA